jgi:hypothetical protein
MDPDRQALIAQLFAEATVMAETAQEIASDGQGPGLSIDRQRRLASALTGASRRMEALARAILALNEEPDPRMSEMTGLSPRRKPPCTATTRGNSMTAETEITALVGRMRAALAEAHSITKAAEVCAKEGWERRALDLCQDIEPLIHDAKSLLHAATILEHHRNEPDEGDGPRAG